MERFKDKIKTDKFLVTMELPPPKGPDIKTFLTNAKKIAGKVDGVNCTDNLRALPHLSCVAGAKLLIDLGLDPILQLTTRDRNVLALQSELLGAAAFGIQNLLSLTGDPPQKNEQGEPTAKAVFELDTMTLMGLVQKLNQGKNHLGEDLNGKTAYCTGAAANPTAPDLEIELSKLKAKIAAGAEFFQTQIIYDADAFKRFAEKTASEKPVVLAGIMPLKSVKMAEFMNTKVWGVSVPKMLFDRLEKASDPEQEGLTITAELIEAIRPYARGIHIMTMGNADIACQIIERCLLKTVRV